MPVVCRTGTAVGLLNVNLRDAGVVLHHLQRAVPELRLQGEHITARPQIGNGKRVPKAMRMAFRHLRLLPQPGD